MLFPLSFVFEEVCGFRLQLRLTSIDIFYPEASGMKAEQLFRCLSLPSVSSKP